MNETSVPPASPDSTDLVRSLMQAGATAQSAGYEGTGHRLRRLRVRRLMRAPPRGVEPETTLAEAEELMDAEDVEWLPVLENGRLVGVVTRTDIRDALSLRVVAFGRPTA